MTLNNTASSLCAIEDLIRLKQQHPRPVVMGISRVRILSILGRSPSKSQRPEKDATSSSVSSVPEKEADATIDAPTTPQRQRILILEKIKQPYTEVEYPVPQVRSDREVIVQNAVIGLNPIDWKAPYVSEPS